MGRIALAYGPPGHKGVTTLMSVGADDATGPLPIERYVQRGGLLAVAVWTLGVLTHSDRLKNLSLGAAVSLFAVQVLSSMKKS